MRDPIPLVLPLACWPARDRHAWQALFVADDLFDDYGPAAKWSEGTRRKRQQGYGQWLSFLARHDPSALEEAPQRRITLERVRDYFVECEQRLAPKSLANLSGDLYAMARVFAPNEDWGWLRLAFSRLNNLANTQTLAPAPSISAHRIYRWSLKRLDELSLVSEGTARQRAVNFRQALLMGFLIARPIRRRALIAMRVGLHLTPNGKGFALNFQAEDMKDKRERSFSLPGPLVVPMQIYLAEHRPALLGRQQHDALWVTHHGKPFTADGIASDLEAVSQKHLGVRLNPHSFRHIAATTIAERDPEHVGIIRDILGHATLDMAEKHYNRATGISSCNALQLIVDDIRQNLPKLPKISTKGNPRGRRK